MKLLGQAIQNILLELQKYKNISRSKVKVGARLAFTIDR